MQTFKNLDHTLLAIVRKQGSLGKCAIRQKCCVLQLIVSIL